MSIQAMAWAIEQQHVTAPLARWVLVSLANYAGADGTGAFPSIARLCLDTGLAERSVQNQLKLLRKAGVIRPGNAKVVAAHILRKDRHPTSYDLTMPRGAPPAPGKVTGCTTESNGVHHRAPRGAPPAPDPFRDPLYNLRAVKNPTTEIERRQLEVEQALERLRTKRVAQ